jgi:hypothetical protein
MENRMNHGRESGSFFKMFSNKRAATIEDGPLLIS